MLIDSACMIFLGVYFYIAKSMAFLMNLLIVLQVIVIIMLWFFVPESPKFYHEKGNKKGFIASLKKIAIVNGKDAQVVLDMDEIRNLDKKP